MIELILSIIIVFGTVLVLYLFFLAIINYQLKEKVMFKDFPPECNVYEKKVVNGHEIEYLTAESAKKRLEFLKAQNENKKTTK